MLHDLQVWLVTNIIAHSPVANLMRTAWAWPIFESIHFLGLCMLIGCIGTFDLRLLGIAKRVPIAAMHRLIPWGILGFRDQRLERPHVPAHRTDQYIYNPSFHLKFLFITDRRPRMPPRSTSPAIARSSVRTRRSIRRCAPRSSPRSR
jgi:hypothetical protein